MREMNIYLAGAMGKFGKENFDKGNNWRCYCKEVLETKGENNGIDVIATNPNEYFSFRDIKPKYASQREVMEFDIHKVRNSDLIIINFNDVYSLGSMAELAIAYERRIPVIGLNEDNQELHPWQIEFCTRIFTDVDDMLDYVEWFYIL